MTPEQRTHFTYWLEALRSGVYEQGTSALRDSDDEYCCLGVACDVYTKAGGEGAWGQFGQDGANGAWYFHTPTLAGQGTNGYLPLEIMEWMGLEPTNLSTSWSASDVTLPGVTEGDLRNDQRYKATVTATYLNDAAKLSFSEIADWLEKAYADA